jgi:hypothetical protein
MLEIINVIYLMFLKIKNRLLMALINKINYFFTIILTNVFQLSFESYLFTPFTKIQ